MLRRDSDGDRDAVPGRRLGRLRPLPGARAAPRRPRLRRARRHRHDRRVADADRRGALRALRGGRRRGRRPGDRGRRHGHLLDRALGSSDRAGRTSSACTAFLVVTPYYNKPPPRGIVEHFKAIADVSDRPIVVYNIPGRVVLNIEPETIAELAEIPTVDAVKQANDDLDQARRIVELGPRPLRRRRQPDLPVPPPRRRGRHLRPHAHGRPAGEGARPRVQGRRRGTRRRIDRELAPI